MFTFTTAMIIAASGTLASPTDVDQAVEREFRLYRIQVYNTYRTRRTEYDRRRMAGDEAYRAWQQAGCQANQAQELMAWFRGAKWASLAQVNRPLPSLPQFPARAPRAMVATPAVEARPSPETPLRTVERFEVRQLEQGETPRSTTLAAHRKPKAARVETKSPRSSWRSVSSALYRGMVFGATRVMP